MFDLEDDDASRREKCYTTVAELPHFIDPKQIPTKKPPFSAILNHPFVHTVEVILPKEVYLAIESSFGPKLLDLRYARVSMSLSSLLEADFFNTYIKTGNILMISEGHPGSDDTFTLKDGILSLELGKAIFERTGLTGTPIRNGGKKHVKERYLVKLNLRQPSMLHGKKGFQRIEWAFKNVLNKTVTWLFSDLATESKGISDDDISLKGNHPQLIACEPLHTHHHSIFTPSFHAMRMSSKLPETDIKEYCQDISEWLAMVSLESSRASANDDVDPYLCRYKAPEIGETQSADLVSLKWHGFIPPKWIMQLFVILFQETAARKLDIPSWLALSSSALGKAAIEGQDGYTIMALPSMQNDVTGEENAMHSRLFICWEYVGASVL